LVNFYKGITMKRISLLLGLAAIIPLVGCQSGHYGSGQKASATLESRSGSSTKGTINFVSQGHDVLVTGTISGLRPDATSAGGHFNPDGKAHGMPGHGHGAHHAGDMPNIKTDANGNAVYSAKVSGLTLDTGKHGIVGKSVVIHRDPDDYKSQPAGNSGPRIACGLIK
jgi:superoxide dismutase, Cu-Zn family